MNRAALTLTLTSASIADPDALIKTLLALGVGITGRIVVLVDRTAGFNIIVIRIKYGCANLSNLPIVRVICSAIAGKRLLRDYY